MSHASHPQHPSSSGAPTGVPTGVQAEAQTAAQPAAPTVVLQSHRDPLPHAWLADTLSSVERWAVGNGFEYRYLGDALFNELTASERRACATQPVVASDLARLRWCQRVLGEGAARVVWCDADTLILNTSMTILSESQVAFGRELWLQGDAHNPRRAKMYKKIHNAFMQFSAGNPVLQFYEFAAARLIDRHAQQTDQPMVAQLAGPKFLTHLHNVVQFDVLESAQVLCPMVAQAVLENDAAVLERYHRACTEPAAALNLCASEVVRGTLSDHQMHTLVEVLQAGDF